MPRPAQGLPNRSFSTNRAIPVATSARQRKPLFFAASFFLLLALLLVGVFWMRRYRATAPLDLEGTMPLVDRAGLLTNQEHYTLLALLELMQAREGLHCVFLTTWDFDEYAPADYVQRAWRQLFPDPQLRTTALLLVVSPGFAHPVALEDVFSDTTSRQRFELLQQMLRMRAYCPGSAEVALRPNFALMTPEHGLYYVLTGSAYVPHAESVRFQRATLAYAYPYVVSGRYFDLCVTTLALALAGANPGHPIAPLLREARAAWATKQASSPVLTKHARVPLARRINQFLRRSPDWAFAARVVLALLAFYFGSLLLLLLLYLALVLVKPFRSPRAIHGANCYLAQRSRWQGAVRTGRGSGRWLLFVFRPHCWVWRALRAEL